MWFRTVPCVDNQRIPRRLWKGTLFDRFIWFLMSFSFFAGLFAQNRGERVLENSERWASEVGTWEKEVSCGMRTPRWRSHIISEPNCRKSAESKATIGFSYENSVTVKKESEDTEVSDDDTDIEQPEDIGNPSSFFRRSVSAVFGLFSKDMVLHARGWPRLAAFHIVDCNGRGCTSWCLL